MPRTVTKTIHVRGKPKRIKVTVYRSVREALDELGSIQVLKDINFMSDMRAQWAVRSEQPPPLRRWLHELSIGN